MSTQSRQTTQLRTPRAAAVAGIIFSVLLSSSLLLLGLAHPGAIYIGIPPEIWSWCLNIIPFAGIAFLWFIGVLRDRIGAAEDRFFATVFLGSGLLFLAMLFIAAAIAGGFLKATSMAPPAAAPYGQFITSDIMDIYATRMAAVFMISTSTILLRTGALPRWLAYCGYAFAGALIVVDVLWEWMLLLFPLWVFLVSIELLLTNRHERPSE